MTILVVEDDPIISRNVSDALIAEAFAVDVAYDGLMAEKFLKKNDYDCVVLDINLPHRNGYEVCKSFRQYNTSTPVIFLTAFEELEDKVEGFDSGGDDYLTKPFFVKELLLRIKAQVNRSNAQNRDQTKEVLVLEDIVVNQRSKTVKRADQEINLTPREYQILLKLIIAKGELVSKQELIREIWGGSFDANTNTIEVYINFLRTKFDKPFARQLIKTKVGFGYYLDLKA